MKPMRMPGPSTLVKLPTYSTRFSWLICARDTTRRGARSVYTWSSTTTKLYFSANVRMPWQFAALALVPVGLWSTVCVTNMRGRCRRAADSRASKSAPDARDRNQLHAVGSEPRVQNEVSGIVDQYAVV